MNKKDINYEIPEKISVSRLKDNPAQAIRYAEEQPLAIESRNKVVGYLIGEALFEKIITFIEDSMDRKIIEESEYPEGKPLEQVMKELGIEK